MQPAKNSVSFRRIYARVYQVNTDEKLFQKVLSA